jgi:hypothetical protein
MRRRAFISGVQVRPNCKEEPGMPDNWDARPAWEK